MNYTITLLCILLTFSVYAQSGTGCICKDNFDPNTSLALQEQGENDCWIFQNTITGDRWDYIPGMALGTRWVLKTGVTPLLEIGNIDNAGDIATTVIAPFTELFQEVRLNTRTDYFSVDLAAAEVTILQPGVYAPEFGLNFAETTASNTQRNNIAFWLEDGTATNTGNNDNPDDNISQYFQGNYMRDASGHNEVSDGGPARWIVVTAADLPYTFRCMRDGISGPSGAQAGGIETLQGTNNFFRLSKID